MRILLIKLTGNFYDGNILNLDKQYLDLLHRNVISTQDSADMYVGDRDQTELFYYSLVPEDTKAVIVLLPGTWDRVEYVLSSNKTLCQLAYDHNIAVLALSVNQRLSLNEEVLAFINSSIEDAIKRYRLPGDRFIIGGFSMGGLFSLRYGALSRQDKDQDSSTAHCGLLRGRADRS
ncbi:MAG: alpha/beta hydrolase [Taibaiella sp.]|nr:alpha/beta hydrolase [Taibaiella sp.]